jgi:hypothetical protein
MRRWVKRFLGAGLVAGVVYAVWRALDDHSRRGPIEWKPQAFPEPPMPVPREPSAPPPAATTSWVEPDGSSCPASHPVKAKLGSGIFHLPDGQMYERTVPDRCYPDAASAEADGLRASKR